MNCPKCDKQAAIGESSYPEYNFWYCSSCGFVWYVNYSTLQLSFYRVIWEARLKEIPIGCLPIFMEQEL